MLTADGVVKVMDFGIAQSADLSQLTATGVLGSPHYLSPEQVEGKADIRSDIYSLGVTLYEMLTGERPYEGESAIDIVLKHLQEPIPSLQELDREIPAKVDKLVAKCLAKDPADRFQTPVDLIEAINKALAKEPEAGEIVEAPEKAVEEVEAEERRRQQEKLEALYEEAVGFLKAKQWQKALDKWAEVQAIYPGAPDPRGVAAIAKRKIERPAEEKRQRENLEALYAEAVGFLEAKEWQKALDKWAKVQAIDPDYPDPQEVAATAKRELTQKVEGTAPAVELVSPVLKEKEAVPIWQRVPVRVRGAAIGGAILLAVVACAMAGVLLVPRVLEKEETPTPTLTRTTVAIATETKEPVLPTPTPYPSYTPSPTHTPMPTDTPVPPTPTPLPPTDTPTPTETPTPVSTPTSIPTPTPEVDFKIVKQDMRPIRPDKCDDLPEIEVRVLDINGEPLDNVRLEIYWDGGQIFKNSGWLGPGYDKATVTAGTFWVKVTGGVPPFDESLYTSEVSRPLSTDQPTGEDLEKAGYCQPGGECADCKLYSYEVVFQRQW
jgi:tetratricopeptide (TPR) repeat protein